MKRKNNRDYARALYEATKGVSDHEAKDVVVAFAKLLARDGALKRAPHIIETFINYAKKQAGIIALNVTTAHGLSDQIRSEIRRHFGGNAEITEAVDPAIIGGVVVRTPEIILNASLKNQLVKLAKHLAK